MTLVHCQRCGYLYEEEDSMGRVLDTSVPFVGGICIKCFDSSYNPVKGWSNMWYVDWISKRRKLLAK